MIATQYINLNMVPSGYPPVVYMSQYDVGRPIGFVVSASGSTPDFDNYTVTLEGTRSDGTPVTAPVTTDGNICALETTATMTNKADRYPAQIVVTDGDGDRIASIPVTMMVVKAAMDEDAEEIEEDRSLYQQYTGTVQSLIADIRTQLNAETAARQAAVSAEASARQAADNTLQSNINAEASTRATQDASLQSQISQLIAPSGEAPSAAEVENARVGADGTVYPTLGDAIRTQVTDVKSAIDDIDYEIYDSVSGTAYWKQGTPINSSSASRITTDLYLNKNNIVGIAGIPSDMYGVLYAWNNGASVGYYKSDGTFTATISEAYKLNASYVFKEILDQFPNYDFQITLSKRDGSNITPAVASNILFYKSRLDIIAEDIDELNDIAGTNTNTLFTTRNDLAYVQGTPTNASSASRITLAFPIERSVKEIYTNRTGLFFRIYAYNGAKHVGYLTASNTFTDSISQAKSFTSVDMSTIWAVSELYEYVIVVQYTTDVTPADGQYIYFLYSMMANANETKSFVENRNIVCFGDSIFGIFRDKNYLDESIPHMVSQATGASCYNAGFGGTRAEESGAANDVICFANLVSAIINNDWTDIDAYVAGQQQYIQDTIAGLKQIDFTKVDIITVAYGTNDWASGVTTAAYKTALKSGITAMITAYPNLRAVLLTPIIRFIGGDGQSTWDYTTDDDRAINSAGYKLPDFAETCEEAAKELHMPCVDNYWHLGINEQNKVTFFGNTANVHPNREGRKLIAERLVRTIT